MDRARVGDDRRLMNINWDDTGKELAAWVCGGLCLLLIFFVATFPYQTLQTRVVTELQRATGLDVRVADWSVEPPSGLEWRTVTLSRAEWPPIHVSELKATIDIWQALSGNLGLDLVMHLDPASPKTGLATGTVAASSFAMDGPITITGQLQQIDLSTFVRQYVTQGMMNGQFSQRVDSLRVPIDAIKGEGTWQAEARDLTVDHIPLGNGRILSLSFSTVTAGLLCRDRVCTVTQLTGNGNDGSFTGDGTITLQQPIQNSQLALSLTVVPGSGFAAKAGTLGLPVLPPGTPFPFKLVGTLAQARIAL